MAARIDPNFNWNSVQSASRKSYFLGNSVRAQTDRQAAANLGNQLGLWNNTTNTNNKNTIKSATKPATELESDRLAFEQAEHQRRCELLGIPVNNTESITNTINTATATASSSSSAAAAAAAPAAVPQLSETELLNEALRILAAQEYSDSDSDSSSSNNSNRSRKHSKHRKHRKHKHRHKDRDRDRGRDRDRDRDRDRSDKPNSITSNSNSSNKSQSKSNHSHSRSKSPINNRYS